MMIPIIILAMLTYFIIAIMMFGVLAKYIDQHDEIGFFVVLLASMLWPITLLLLTIMLTVVSITDGVTNK
jgi:hypothetical protein